jgi:4-diphosphocytidyl-2-C-methyl-D-erythritol kinase
VSTPLEALRGAAGARVEAQAKVNLRLKILAREASGFHQLETLFLRLALADTVRVRRTAGTRSLDVAGLSETSDIGPVERNLAWRAADAYLDAVRWPGGFAIELEKRIPIGGGLGGGSADAGAVLRALDAIAPSPLGEPALLRLAATLGADVPFLASEHAYALGWGRGERLLALPAPPARRVVLLVPPFAVNTAAAYGWLTEARAAAAGPATAAGVLDLMALGDWEALAGLARNDFEPVVAAHRPEIAQLVAGLRAAGCSPAMMSGSGSVVFGILAADAEKCLLTLSAASSAMMTSTATRVEPVVPLD